MPFVDMGKPGSDEVASGGGRDPLVSFGHVVSSYCQYRVEWALTWESARPGVLVGAPLFPIRERKLRRDQESGSGSEALRSQRVSARPCPQAPVKWRKAFWFGIMEVMCDLPLRQG